MPTQFLSGTRSQFFALQLLFAGEWCRHPQVCTQTEGGTGSLGADGWVCVLDRVSLHGVGEGSLADL